MSPSDKLGTVQTLSAVCARLSRGGRAVIVYPNVIRPSTDVYLSSRRSRRHSRAASEKGNPRIERGTEEHSGRVSSPTGSPNVRTRRFVRHERRTEYGSKNETRYLAGVALFSA